MAKKDSLKLDGLTNVHDNMVEVPAEQVNPYASRDYRKKGALPYSQFKEGVDHIPLAYDLTGETEEEREDNWLRNRADRSKIIPKSWLWKLSKLGFITDMLTNPAITVTDEEEKWHIEQYNRESEGYITRWENLNRRQFPPQVFEQMQKPEFRDWWYHDPDGLAVPKGPSVITDPSGMPELVGHATLGRIDRKKGFVQLHISETDKAMELDAEQEIGPHFGTKGQMLDRVLHQGIDQKHKDSGVLPARQQLPSYVKEHQPFSKQAKFYMGWIKMNNPFVVREDKFNWTFDNVLDYMISDESGGPLKTEYDPDSGHIVTIGSHSSILSKFTTKDGRQYTYSKDPSELPYDNKGIFYGESGSGTVLEPIMEYAIELAEKDGIDLTAAVDWDEIDIDEYTALQEREMEGEDVSYEKFVDQELIDDLQYYRLLGLMKFMQDDLGYDGIKYWNQVEDKGASDWSYIIFNPNQFKSLHNQGSFKWGTREEPHRDFMTNTNTNKYRKVS